MSFEHDSEKIIILVASKTGDLPNDTCTRLDDWVDDDFFGDHTLCDELYLMMIFAWVQGVFPFIAIGGSFCCTKKELVDQINRFWSAISFMISSEKRKTEFQSVELDCRL